MGGPSVMLEYIWASETICSYASIMFYLDNWYLCHNLVFFKLTQLKGAQFLEIYLHPKREFSVIESDTTNVHPKSFTPSRSPFPTSLLATYAAPRLHTDWPHTNNHVLGSQWFLGFPVILSLSSLTHLRPLIAWWRPGGNWMELTH